MTASPGIRGSMVVIRAIMEDPPGFKPPNLETYLNSATGVKRRVMMTASPGIRGSMEVS